MDTNVLMLSMFFGCVGMGMFAYGKKASRMVPLLSGVGLMVLPYFFTNLLLMTLVCLAMMGLPWIVTE